MWLAHGSSRSKGKKLSNFQNGNRRESPSSVCLQSLEEKSVLQSERVLFNSLTKIILI